MDRREFLKLTAAAGAVLLAERLRLPGVLAAEPAGAMLDKATAQRELAAHRIARIVTRRLQDRFPRLVGPNSHLGPAGRGGGYPACIVTTDKGATGWAMGGGNENEFERFVGTTVGELFNLDDGTGADVPGWLEKALYDLAGNILDAPVYDLLGAAGPRAVLLYSGAIYFEDLMPHDKPQGIEGVLKACQQDYDAGYRAFKLKIGRGYRWMDGAEGLARDIEVTHAVRDQFDDCRILVDVNDGYTIENAIDYVNGVADCDLYWIEEPFLENADDLRRLKNAMRLAGCTAFIADGEARRGRPDTPTAYGGYPKPFVERLYALAAEDLVDAFVMDLGLVGFTRWWKAMPELRKARVWASPHTWAWIPRPYYAAHLAAGAGNVCIIEGIPGTTAGVDYSAYTMKNGYLQMPRTPGFGLALED